MEQQTLLKRREGIEVLEFADLAIGVFGIVQEREQSKIIFLREGIVFVVVALGAIHRGAHPDRQCRVHAVDDRRIAEFLVVGAAAFLGAGYRVPLAAVTFVAESTGRPGFVVPGLLAAVAAERLEMVLADLRDLGPGPTIVAEGPQLFPDLIAPLMQTPEHGLWLLPTPEFGQQGVAGRRAGGLRGEAAQRRRDRDVLLLEATLLVHCGQLAAADEVASQLLPS